MIRKLDALYDNIVVEPYELEDSYSGNIIVPDMGKESAKIGKVLTVGLGRWYMGQFIKTVLKEGDIVVIPPMSFTKFEVDGKEYWAGQEQNILCVINNIED